MIFLGKLLALAVAKKIVAYSIARMYGFPRLYRRATRLNHRLFVPGSAPRGAVQRGLRASFRLPGTLYGWAQATLRTGGSGKA